MTRMLDSGLFILRSIRISMATLAPSTGSERGLFCAADLIDSMTFVHPGQALFVIGTNGQDALLEPNVTKPSLSRPPKDWIMNFNKSRRRVIFKECIDEETGITRTMSTGT